MISKLSPSKYIGLLSNCQNFPFQKSLENTMNGQMMPGKTRTQFRKSNKQTSSKMQKHQIDASILTRYRRLNCSQESHTKKQYNMQIIDKFAYQLCWFIKANKTRRFPKTNNNVSASFITQSLSRATIY
jgi:hypothetical protein